MAAVHERLIAAVHDGKIELIKVLLNEEETADVLHSPSGSPMSSPLGTAIACDDIELVEVLLKHRSVTKAKLNEKNEEPLLFCIAELFVEHLMEENEHDEMFQAQRAMMSGKSHEEWEADAGKRSAAAAATEAKLRGEEGRDLRVLRMLLESGADPNLHPKDETFTLLHVAAWFGLTSWVKLLCEFGADANVVGRYEGETGTPAQFAISRNHEDTARAIISNVLKQMPDSPKNEKAKEAEDAAMKKLLEGEAEAPEADDTAPASALPEKV